MDHPTPTDSTFWFSERIIPQYDLLVLDGVISQDEADDYRRRRRRKDCLWH